MDKEKYCILENDGIALCVCKHRPCEQLKRLEQENEKLKQVTNDSIIEQEKLVAKVNELQAENEHYRKEAYRLADGLNKTENLAFIYKQALQEIRCVVDKNISFMDTSSTTKAMIRIQAKINEVIGAEE